MAKGGKLSLPPLAPPPCAVCTDTPPNWMSISGITCKDRADQLDTQCVTDWWASNRFCDYTCEQIGLGYDGSRCCAPPNPPNPPTAPPPSLPTPCFVCDDAPAGWLSSCATLTAPSAETNCGKISWHTSKKYCRASCFNYGYRIKDDDNSWASCCASPTPPPSPPEAAIWNLHLTMGTKSSPRPCPNTIEEAA